MKNNMARTTSIAAYLSLIVFGLFLLAPSSVYAAYNTTVTAPGTLTFSMPEYGGPWVPDTTVSISSSATTLTPGQSATLTFSVSYPGSSSCSSLFSGNSGGFIWSYPGFVGLLIAYAPPGDYVNASDFQNLGGCLFQATKIATTTSSTAPGTYTYSFGYHAAIPSTSCSICYSAETYDYLATQDITVGSAAAPTATLKASQTSIVSGGSSTLTWSSTNAASCTGNGFSTGGAISGSITVTPASTTTYGVTCGTASASAKVTVGSSVSGTCSVSPPSIGTGGSATWTASPSGGTGTYTYAWTGTNALSGTTKQVTKQYNTAGTKTASVTITDSNGISSAAIPCSNNLTVTAPPGIDLSADGISPTNAKTGKPVNFNTTITNGGGSSTVVGFTDLLQLASDSSGTGATDIGTYANTALAGGRSAPVSIAYTFTYSGIYYMRACADKSSAADQNGVIAETNEDNNCSDPWTAIAVTGTAPPSISSCIPSPAGAAPNQPVTWTVSVAGFSTPPTTYGWSVMGGNPASGSSPTNTFTTMFNTGGGHSPTVTASNGTQSAGPVSCTPVTVSGQPYTCGAGVAATISASPSRVVAGSSSTVNYSATGVTAGTTCTLTGPNAPAQTATADSSCNISAGSFGTGNITTQAVYTITCAGASGQTAIVNVTPHFQEF